MVWMQKSQSRGAAAMSIQSVVSIVHGRCCLIEFLSFKFEVLILKLLAQSRHKQLQRISLQQQWRMRRKLQLNSRRLRLRRKRIPPQCPCDQPLLMKLHWSPFAFAAHLLRAWNHMLGKNSICPAKAPPLVIFSKASGLTPPRVEVSDPAGWLGLGISFSLLFFHLASITQASSGVKRPSMSVGEYDEPPGRRSCLPCKPRMDLPAAFRLLRNGKELPRPRSRGLIEFHVSTFLSKSFCQIFGIN